MLNTVLGALLPMVVTFLLGFVAAWHHDLGPNDASILNRMVLLYAVPLALFAGTVTTSRTALSQDIPLVIALCVAIIGLYGAVFLFSRIVLRLPMSISALHALTASAPAVPFVGPAVLGDLFGGLSAIPIAIASLVINLTVVPPTILFCRWIRLRRDPQGTWPRSDGKSIWPRPQGHLSRFSRQTRGNDQTADCLGTRSRFRGRSGGLRIPQIFVHSLSMLGQASGGVALFACGIVLASGPIKVNWTSCSSYS